MKEIHIILTVNADNIHGAEIAKTDEHLAAPHFVFRQPNNMEYANITSGVQVALAKDKVDLLVSYIDKAFLRVENTESVAISELYLSSWQYLAIAMQIMEAVKPDSRELLLFRRSVALPTGSAT